jgi:NAD(P)-dependent dehydrogenase (short-subunit alcohol dehydrogenase family)
MTLSGKNVLITGAAKRIGRSLALMVARAGADVIIHFGNSRSEAESAQEEVQALGRKAFLLQADLADPIQAAGLMARAREFGPVVALVNNAAVFEPLSWDNCSLDDWNQHLMVNLTVPFLLSQAFARSAEPKGNRRIVNLLDWRAQRPGPDHLPYTISKAALAALTRSLAVALAPNVTVNGLALGAVLPPSDGKAADDILDRIPAHRWADMEEVGEALLFLLDGPTYITGEIINVDGGRHLL